MEHVGSKSAALFEKLRMLKDQMLAEGREASLKLPSTFCAAVSPGCIATSKTVQDVQIAELASVPLGREGQKDHQAFPFELSALAQATLVN